MKGHSLRLLLVLAALTLAVGIGAAQPERPPKGHGKYLIVLWEPGTPIPGKKDERMKRVPEPDVAKLGGRLLAKQANRRVVFLPYGIAKQLRKHEAVSFVQRIWTGEPFSEWNESEMGGDTALRSPEVSADTDPTFTWEKSYEYDADGNITDIGADQFEYDDLGRLTTAVVNGDAQAYFYDSFGNLTATSWPGGSVAVPTDPSTNRMTGQTYDAAGNVTSRKDRGTYEYDSLNMIVKVEALPQIGKRRILYDANDERIGTIIDSSLHRWTIRDFDGQILREFSGYDGGLNLVWSWEQDHIRGGGQLIAGETQQFGYMYEQSPQPAFLYGGKRHYHLDHLGSVRVVTNAAGRAISENDFFPFGREANKRYQEQLNQGQYHTDGMRFAGHWRDNMGHSEVEDDEYLDYMHARYYDPNLGRFLSADSALGDPHRPQTWNRYSYAGNDPIGAIDRSGLAPIRIGMGETITVFGDVPMVVQMFFIHAQLQLAQQLARAHGANTQWRWWSAVQIARWLPDDGLHEQLGYDTQEECVFDGPCDPENYLFGVGGVSKSARLLLLGRSGTAVSREGSKFFGRWARRNGSGYTVRVLGRFTEFSVNVPGNVPGSYTRWVKVVDQTGKTVKLYHDTFDKTHKFINRGIKLPGPERHVR